MSPGEKERRLEAAQRARTAAEGEHVDVRFRDNDPPGMLCCMRCGLIRPRAGWPKPCRGQVHITIRGGAL